MKKIAFFHPYFAFGGVEKTNIRLSQYFRSLGYEVDFVSISFTEHFKEEINKLGIGMVKLDAKRTIQAIPALRRYMITQKNSCEQFFFISCQNFANLIGVIAAPRNKKGLKLILSERLHPDEFKYNGKQKKGKIILALMKCLYKRADAVVANSKETAVEIERITGVKAKYIYNPTLTGNYKELAEEVVDQEWFTQENPIIISTGRLAYEKGYDTLIKAFEKVQQKIDCRLVIIGEGEERKTLEQLTERLNIADKVWMPGYDANPYKYVSKADVFVLSSRFEGLPNTLIEALAVGTPCVSTRCKSGPTEILLDGAGGLLVDVDEATELAEAILQVLLDKTLGKQLLSCAQNSLYRFENETVGEAYITLLNQL